MPGLAVPAAAVPTLIGLARDSTGDQGLMRSSALMLARAGLALANRLGLGPVVHGTPDDIPLSPRRLTAEARRAGLEPELHAVTYGWRRLPPPAQRVLQALDPLGSNRVAGPLGHTLMLIARRGPLRTSRPLPGA